MIIEKSSIQLNSQHQLKEQSKETESLRFWRTERQPLQNITPSQVDMYHPGSKVASEKQTIDTSYQLNAAESLKVQLIKQMIKQVTGQEFELFSPGQLQDDIESVEITAPIPPNQSGGVGMVYERTSIYSEQETTSFLAEGTIKTQDGKSIDLSISLKMSRSFYSESSFTFRAGQAEKIDPLVVNFEGKAAELSATKFEFDIDADGNPDQISILKPSSGFLAVDKNHDGFINDGSELFGPQSGNGFSDLAAYDNDHNNFIDEADSIYNSLRIWQRNEEGSQQLFSLADKEIGAIFLGHVSTPYQLKTNENQSLGEVSHTGVFISENGKTGTVQQIDFSV